MRRSLLVTPHRGQEWAVFGALLDKIGPWDIAALSPRTHDGDRLPLDRWNAALAPAHGRAVYLDLPDVDPALYDLDFILPRLARHLEGYDTIYVPCPSLEGELGIPAALVGAALHREARVIMLAGGGGVPQQVHSLDSVGFERALECLAGYDRRELEADMMIQTPLAPTVAVRHAPARDCLQFALHFGPIVTDFSGWYEALAGVFEDPWGFRNSAYERARHRAELELLGDSPGDIAEVGACTGIFTRKLMEMHGAERVTCIEPHAGFAAGLRQLGCTVVQTSAHRFVSSFDTLVLSCCLYDMQVWPSGLIAATRRRVMTSHGPSYEREVVVPAMKAAGWRISDRRALGRATEVFLDIPITRQGALMHLWTRD